MDVRFVAPDLRRFDELKSEALILSVSEHERPLQGAAGLVDWRLSGSISRLLLQGEIRGTMGEQALVPLGGQLPFDKLFLVGVGVLDDFDAEREQGIHLQIFRMLRAARIRSALMALPHRSESLRPERSMESFLAAAGTHLEMDQVTLIEEPDTIRAMMPVLERERRRSQADADS